MTIVGRPIVVIDKQPTWRDRLAQTLEKAGYSVTAVDNYALDRPVWDAENERPALIILGCVTIGTEEHDLIGHLLDHKHHLIVISTSLPSSVMRSIFLLGAKDVVDKSYDPDWLINTVEEVLKNVQPRSSFDES